MGPLYSDPHCPGCPGAVDTERRLVATMADVGNNIHTMGVRVRKDHDRRVREAPPKVTNQVEARRVGIALELRSANRRDANARTDTMLPAPIVSRRMPISISRRARHYWSTTFSCSVFLDS